MTEYIDKQAARPDEFCVGVSCQECPFLKDPLYGGCRVDDFIMALPPADVRPVIRGRWVFNEEDGHCYCSECGGVSPMYDQNGDECDCPNYCPNCGADMREHEEKPKKDQFEGWSEELKETYRNLLANLNLEGGDAE